MARAKVIAGHGQPGAENPAAPGNRQGAHGRAGGVCTTTPRPPLLIRSGPAQRVAADRSLHRGPGEVLKDLGASSAQTARLLFPCRQRLGSARFSLARITTPGRSPPRSADRRGTGSIAWGQVSSAPAASGNSSNSCSSRSWRELLLATLTSMNTARTQQPNGAMPRSRPCLRPASTSIRHTLPCETSCPPNALPPTPELALLPSCKHTGPGMPICTACSATQPGAGTAHSRRQKPTE